MTQTEMRFAKIAALILELTYGELVSMGVSLADMMDDDETCPADRLALMLFDWADAHNTEK